MRYVQDRSVFPSQHSDAIIFVYHVYFPYRGKCIEKPIKVSARWQRDSERIKRAQQNLTRLPGVSGLIRDAAGEAEGGGAQRTSLPATGKYAMGMAKVLCVSLCQADILAAMIGAVSG